MSKKLAFLVLVFSLVFGPLTPVLAEETAPAEPVAPAETSQTTPVENPTETTENIPGSPDTETDATPDTTPVPEEGTSEEGEMALNSEEETEILGNQRNVLNFEKFAKVDESSGSLQFEIPISVPEGRNGFAPQISLQYSSKNPNENTVIAPGWTVNVPYIERLNKKGLNRMFTDNYFTSSLSGELTTTDGTNFFPKIEEGSFIKYTFTNGAWTATDKEGKIYKFGTNSESIQKNPNNESTRQVRWFLTEIRDTNDNFIRFDYFDSNTNFGQTYPRKVYYTGNGSTDGIFEIEFIYEDRPDYYTQSNLGFPVETRSRMQKVVVRKSSIDVRRYQLEFTQPLPRKVSILKKITETGISEAGIETVLPAYEFTYQDSDTPGWEVANGWELPISFSTGRAPKAYFTEINGDGLPDIIHSYAQGGLSIGDEVYLHNGTGWTLENTTNWTLPTDGHFYSGEDGRGYRIVDVNGDGLDDLIQSYGDIKKALINNGSNCVDTPSWYPPVMFNLSGGKDNGVKIADINGDGLPDLIHTNNQNQNKVYLNTGTGWEYAEWGLPDINFVDVQNRDNGFIEVDVNGDGLTDFIRMFRLGSNQQEQFINTGNGNYEFKNSFSGISGTEAFIENRADRGFRTADVNGDGQTDFIRYLFENNTTHHKSSYIDLGSSWQDTSPIWDAPATPFMVQPGSRSSLVDHGTRLTDFNGDGMIDFIRKQSSSGETEAYTNKSKKVDLLSEIKYPTGGKTKVEYKTAQQYRDTNGALLNPKVPFSIFTVSKLTNEDNGNLSENNYVYKDGFFYTGGGDVFERKFAGFGQVVKTDPVGNITKTYFHQGDTTNTALGEFDDHISKAGKVYRVEEYDNSGNLFRLSINKWDKANLGTGRDFVNLARETVLQYDGDNDHADVATEYLYNNTNGNLNQKMNYGLVTANTDGSFTDTGTDRSTEVYSYATNTTKNILGLPSVITKYNQNVVKVQETKSYYDGQPLGSVTYGNETKRENWVTGSTYINTQRTYNSLGLVTSETDPKGNVTTYNTYDTWNLYPTQITNPLQQVTNYKYDYNAGKVKEVTDANNFTYQTTYDGLGRILEEKIPNEAPPHLPITKTKYVYTDTSGAVSVKKTDYLNKDLFVDIYKYFDGFGRLIQERKSRESISSANFAVKDIVYNNRGLVEKETIAYGGATGNKTNPSSNNLLYTSYTYDALGRPLTISNTLGTTNYSYDDLKTEITDAKGKVKRFFKDAFGNLSKVEEINAGATYTTTYNWDVLGNLTKITDALGNVRNFTYDGLGRRKTAEDLHATTDTTFGVWQFSYDNSGNLTQTISPNSHTVNYTYNGLNQILTEDYTGTTGNDITYTHNTCTNGKGRLCNVVVTNTGNIGYTYGPNDRPLSESKYLNGLMYITAFNYDRQGNITKMVYPDNSEVWYSYNMNGLLEKVDRKEAGGTIQTVISNLNYTPFETLEMKTFGNAVSTTFSHDGNKMYQLKRILTTHTNPSALQDLNYTYDAVGNITKIIDNSATDTAKTVDYVYDDLHRLTSAITTGGANGQNYNQTFSYNAIGNILSNPLGSYIYGSTNYANPHAATSIGGVTQTYDNNGNLLSDGSLTNTWNYKNQLTGVVKAGITSSYKYDHEGNRVSETVGATTTTFPNKFYNVTNTGKKTKNIYANGELVATVETVGAVVTPYYIHTDHLGSSNIVTNQSGARVETLDYFPFGDVRLNVKTTSFDSSRKYIGEEMDESTGLNYLNARYYNSKQGRFLSQDPAFLDIGSNTFEKDYNRKLQRHLANPQALNSYSYANNNPVVYKDPEGDIAFVPLLIMGAVVALNAYDTYDTVKTVSDPNVSIGKKAFAIGLSLSPLGEGKAAGKAGKEVFEQIFRQTNKNGQVLMEGVENEKILNLIRDNYRATTNKLIGDGSAVDAMLHTLKTGGLVGESDHIIKVQQNINRISNNLKSGVKLNSSETKALNKIFQNSKNALKNLANKKYER